MGLPSQRLSFAVLLTSLLILSGCSISFAPPDNTTAQSGLGALTGMVHGGRQAVSNAHLFVFAAGTGGDAGPSIAASTANASTSLLTSVLVGAYPTAFDATIGGYYVTTGAQGDFVITGEYTCTLGTQIYLYAVGGKPDGVTTNLADGFMAVLGNCPASGTLAGQVGFVYMNEVSTVAAAYALAGFATDATHISSSGTALAKTGIANAAANTAQLYNLSLYPSGAARTVTPNGNGTVPQTLLNSLGNTLAACVNSGGSTSAQCSTLFADAKSTGSTGTAPTDTATAAINIAHNPGSNVSALFTLPSPVGYPYTPNLGATTPNDFTVGITYGGFDGPYGIAIDAAGSAWISNGDENNTSNNAIKRLSNLGVLTNTYTDPGLEYVIGIAIDGNGAAWAAGTDVVRITSAGGLTDFSPSSLPIPECVAIDSSNDVFVTNIESPAQTVELSTTGTNVVGSPYTVGSPNEPEGIAIDHAKNAWVMNFGTGGGNQSLTKITNPGTSATGTNTSLLLTSGANQPRGIAVDSLGFVWVTGQSSSTAAGVLIKITSADVVSATYTGAGLTAVGGQALAIDGAGNVWIGNTNHSVSAFTNAGVAITPSTGYTGGAQSFAGALAIDGSGDVWIPNQGAIYPNDNGATVVELIGAATPVVTPISPNYPGLLTNGLGIRP